MRAPHDAAPIVGGGANGTFGRPRLNLLNCPVILAAIVCSRRARFLVLLHGIFFFEKTKEIFMRRIICTIAGVVLVVCMIAPMATAQQGQSNQQATTDPASNPDQELGRRFLVKADQLPPPKSDPVAASRSLVIPYAGQAPRVME